MNWWKKISEVGLQKDVDSAEERRVRLTNRVIFASIWFPFSYVPLYITLGVYELIAPISAIVVLTGSLFFISRKGKHELAAILLSILLMLNIIWITTIQPGGEGHLYLVMMSLLGFAMIRSIKVGAFLFLFGFLGFYVVEIAQRFIPALVIMPSNDVVTGLYLFNVGAVMVACFYLLFHLKLTNEDYAKNILNQKSEIEEQHGELEETHQAISDSIDYAKRIQEAILPTDEAILDNLPNSFVFFKPKDVVSGDFYWMETVGESTIFAVADCTGHGVPGAMLSVVCVNALNRSVREFGIVDPAEILNKTREIVIETFDNGTSNVEDGMDIAICNLNNKSRELSYAGANNPLYYVERKNGKPTGEFDVSNDTHCLREIRANKQPIGKFAIHAPFSTTNIQLSEGDWVFLSSDGYADQFGGPNCKKFKYQPFKQLLLENSSKPESEQKQSLAKEFDKWRDGFMQIDDVCVIGVKV